MIKELMHDPIFLACKSELATEEDLATAQDLLDTLMMHKETCVGMAANMIGVKKRIIAFLDESGRVPACTVMLNPEILKRNGPYDTEESWRAAWDRRTAKGSRGWRRGEPDGHLSP